MQAETLQAALTDLSKLHDIATSDLEEVVESYPYFQTAHLLLLKKYQISGDSKFTDYLSTAATYAPDRKWLHHFIEEVEVPEPKAVLEGTAEPSTVDEPVTPEAQEPAPVAEDEIQPEEDLEEETAQEPEQEQPEAEKEEGTGDSSVADEVLAWLKDRDNEPEAKETEHEDGEPELEEPKEEAEAEETEPIEEERFEERFPEDPEVHPYPEREPIPEDRIEVEPPFEEPAEKSETEQEEKPLASPGGYSFLEWFKHLDEPKQQEPEPAVQPAGEPSEEDLIDQAITNEAAYQVEALEEKPSAREPSREIPQPFKSDEPKEVDETDLQQVEQQAQKSVEWGNEVVSETLAKVFAAQGKTQKAIEMYERLRLKYPGKSDYFASAISKLQDN